MREALKSGRDIRWGGYVHRPRWSWPPKPEASDHGRAGQGELMSQEQHQQQSLPVFVNADEEALSQQSIVRLTAWLRGELEILPAWHPLHHEYQQQLRSLRKRVPPGPRRLSSPAG